ncbi:MAG TPA: NTP transferase domain-containing protein [Anaerolineales bacterium]|nr:NTP transferase domain-containing protein [Anaerolineales bacterium]
MKTTAVILAAGRGTRMQSAQPKVMHPLLGEPMVSYSVRAAAAVTGRLPIVVVGYRAEQVRAALDGRARFVVQTEQKGTGHALLQAEPLLRNRTDTILVAFGDMPLISPETFEDLLDSHTRSGGPLTMLSVIADDPRGFGRVVRGPDGAVRAIVEEAVASPEQLAIRELNVSGYALSDDWVWEALGRIQPSPIGEFYLTDLVEIAVSQGHPVQAVLVRDPAEAIGINTPEHLREAEAFLARRRAATHKIPAGAENPED